MSTNRRSKTYYLALAGLNRALYQLVLTSRQGRTRNIRDDDRLGPRDRLSTDEEDQEECPDLWLLGDGQWKNEAYGEADIRSASVTKAAKSISTKRMRLFYVKPLPIWTLSRTLGMPWPMPSSTGATRMR